MLGIDEQPPGAVRPIVPRLVPSDPARARKLAAGLLFLTGKVLQAAGADVTPLRRSYVAAAFVHQVRRYLHLLRLLEIDRDPGFGRIAARTRERLVGMRTAFASLPDMRAALRLFEAELLALSGDLVAAQDALEPVMLSISTIQSRDLRDEVAIRYFDFSLGRAESRAALHALLGFLATRSRHGMVGARFERTLRLTARQAVVLRSNGLPLTALVIQTWSKMVRAAPRRIASRIANILLERVGMAVVRRESARRMPRSGLPVRAVRAMGGIGDLLMMTPGLRALARHDDRPIEFAVPKRYLGLFETNPFVAALGLEDLPPQWFSGGRIIDLTDCPASITESATAPMVVVNRIEIFARALGVRQRELRRHGLQPVFEPSAAARERAAEWLRSHQVCPGEFVAIQIAAAERYRSWSRVAEVARRLAGSRQVVAFDDKPSAEFAALAQQHGNIRLAIGLELSLGLALACEARLIVAPDSALLHLAGARGIPCVGMFGPTDGVLRMGAYPLAVAVSRRAELPCSPCWRNQAMPCALTGGMSSHCLDSLEVAPVMEAIERLLR